MGRNRKLTIGVGTAVRTVLGAAALFAEDDDKYKLGSRSGIAFADFKRIRGLGGGFLHPDR